MNLPAHVVSGIQDLVMLSNNLHKQVILFEDDFRLLSPIYDYHDLYIANQCLCGTYNYSIQNHFFGITTFEIPVYKDKNLSAELLRFINRSQDLYHLLKCLKPLKLKNKYFLDVVLKNKKAPGAFKKYYQNFQLLA